MRTKPPTPVQQIRSTIPASTKSSLVLDMAGKKGPTPQRIRAAITLQSRKKEKENASAWKAPWRVQPGIGLQRKPSPYSKPGPRREGANRTVVEKQTTRLGKYRTTAPVKAVAKPKLEQTRKVGCKLCKEFSLGAVASEKRLLRERDLDEQLMYQYGCENGIES